MKLREVWEESFCFSVPSPFFLLCGCLWGSEGWEGGKEGV